MGTKSIEISKSNKESKKSLKYQFQWFLVPALLIFATVLILFGVGINELFGNSSSNAETFNKTEKVKNMLDRRVPKYSGCINVKENVVQCNGTADIQGINNFLSIYQKDEVKLNISNIIFPNGLIENYWIKVTNSQITELNIEDCNLKDIGKNAFESSIFQSLTKLQLKGVQISRLFTETFKGLTSLKSLILYNNVTEMTYIGNILEYLKNLNVFEFYGVNENLKIIDLKSLKTFLVTSYPNKIIRLVLENISIEFIWSEKLFDKYVMLKILKLINCQIKELKEETFLLLNPTLEYLDLSRNNLKNVKRGLFDKYFKNPKFKINVNDNKWICNCHLKDFVNDYIKHESQFIGQPKCYSAHSKDISIDVGTYCSPFIQIKCDSTECEKCMGIHCIGNGYTNYLQLKNCEANFSLLSITPTKIKIVVENSEVSFAMLWFDRNNQKNLFHSGIKYNPLCTFENHNEEFVVDGLIPNISYTFCLMKYGQTTISPFNCLSYFVPASGNDQSSCQTSKNIFILFGIAVILSVLFGASTLYFVMRMKPTLLKGSRRVFVVKNKPKGIIVMPRENNTGSDKIIKSPPRRQSDSSVASYMTTSNLYDCVIYQKLSAFKNNVLISDEAISRSSIPRKLVPTCAINKGKKDCIYAVINKKSTKC